MVILYIENLYTLLPTNKKKKKNEQVYWPINALLYYNYLLGIYNSYSHRLLL